MNYPIDPRLSTLTVRELPVGRKQQLSGYLNVEQVIFLIVTSITETLETTYARYSYCNHINVIIAILFYFS